MHILHSVLYTSPKVLTRKICLTIMSSSIEKKISAIHFSSVSLSAVHIRDFHIFTVIYSSLHGFIWNQHNDQLPVGLLAHLVEHCMVSQRSWVQIPYRPEFFLDLVHYCLSSVHYCEVTFIHVFICSSNI